LRKRRARAGAEEQTINVFPFNLGTQGHVAGRDGVAVFIDRLRPLLQLLKEKIPVASIHDQREGLDLAGTYNRPSVSVSAR